MSSLYVLHGKRFDECRFSSAGFSYGVQVKEAIFGTDAETLVRWPAICLPDVCNVSLQASSIQNEDIGDETGKRTSQVHSHPYDLKQKC